MLGAIAKIYTVIIHFEICLQIRILSLTHLHYDSIVVLHLGLDSEVASPFSQYTLDGGRWRV